VPKSTEISGTEPRLGHEDDGLRKASNNSHRDNETSFTLETVMPISDRSLRFLRSLQTSDCRLFSKIVVLLGLWIILPIWTATAVDLPDGVFQAASFGPALPDHRDSFYRVTRVVGPGVSWDYDAEGFLLPERHALFVQNLVVSSTATVTVDATASLTSSFASWAAIAGVNGAVVDVRFFINGKEIGTPARMSLAVDGQTAASIKQKITFPTAFLRFGRKLKLNETPVPCADHLPAETTCPGLNTITARYKVQVAKWNPVDPGTPIMLIPLEGLNIGLNVIGAAAAMQLRDNVQVRSRGHELRFRAMSPVMLVHGFNANTGWFYTYNFESAFRTKGIPFELVHDPGVTFPRSDFMDEEWRRCNDQSPQYSSWRNAHPGYCVGDRIDARLTQPPLEALGEGSIEDVGNVLQRRIPELARGYGSRQVHLVGHSKGGLYSRAFLKGPSPYRNCNADIQVANQSGFSGVKTVVFLNTPHHGSIGAEVRTAATEALKPYKGQYVYLQAWLTQLASTLGPYTIGIHDLVPEAVKRFNGVAGLPPRCYVDANQRYRTLYYATHADLDINNNRRADLSAEYEGYPVGATVVYNLVGTVKSVTAEVVPADSGGGQLVPTLVANWTYQSSFRENDIVVTTESAQYPGYALLQSLPFDKNHSTIEMEDVANLVIYKLWLSEVRNW
jgi:hypothetical protein